MTSLTPIKLDDGTEIYIETRDDLDSPAPNLAAVSGEQQRTGAKGGGAHLPSFKQIEGAIRAYTNSTLNAFRELAIAEVETVTLEFGVAVSGMTGIPYIATGEAGCNLRVTVECRFPHPEPPSPR
ncbi:CU044_2847 family protein [Trichothermofontia sichuanensis B231]|uniref:CU044_2847 family protein n=1 Tax=Trichothermofontia sichuanensis TaxID=3045816 RepID=UPI00224644A2|nr:CU044_2847 family protein [Trichothermofontia sichuanensis]UZQ52914.1 CU044_2847 family protein [Trichothermofontia sichuanensis B231]